MITVLDESQVRNILEKVGWLEVVDAIASTFREEALDKVISPPKTILHLDEHCNDYRVMPSYRKELPGYIGTKIVCACPRNPERNLPMVMGTYILNDAETQQTLMVAGASVSTAWRTAAATAVAVRVLYNRMGGQSVGLIGCGAQAMHHVPALDAVMDIKEFLVNDVDKTRAAAFRQKFVDLGDDRVVVADRRAIFDNCHVVVTMTPTTQPHIFKRDLPDRKMVLAAIGGDSDRKIEVAAEVMGVSDHYCDSYEQVSHTGTVMRALDRGIIRPEDLKSIGDLMVGNAKENPERKLKLFLSTGVALEDLAINTLVYENRHLLED
jgi:ornithine cyclodeaminase/alanine dehydrogenase